jgi:hypothetical protein
MIQEDPGASSRLAKIWSYDVAADRMVAVAQADPHRCGPDADGTCSKEALTSDEEWSGIVEVSETLGAGWFLLSLQAHSAHPDPAVVEGGQLLLMRVSAAR